MPGMQVDQLLLQCGGWSYSTSSASYIYICSINVRDEHIPPRWPSDVPSSDDTGNFRGERPRYPSAMQRRPWYSVFALVVSSFLNDESVGVLVNVQWEWAYHQMKKKIKKDKNKRTNEKPDVSSASIYAFFAVRLRRMGRFAHKYRAEDDTVWRQRNNRKRKTDIAAELSS